jgi:Skp family chaperone for outer membrane proteins
MGDLMMNIYKKLAAVCVVSLSTFSVAAVGAEAHHAIGTTPPSFGIVDVDAVFQKDSGHKIESLQSSFNKHQDSLDQEQQALEGALQTFRKDAPAMSVKAREAREVELRKDSEALSAKRAQLTQEYFKSEQEIKMAFMNAMTDAAAVVAKEKGLQVVLPRQVVLYGAESMDMTSDVIASMK